MRVHWKYIFEKSGWILRTGDLTPSKIIVMSLRADDSENNIVAEYDRATNEITFFWKDLEAEQVMAILEALGVLDED